MRPSIKNLIATTLTLIVLTSTTIAAKADDNAVTILTDVKKVNKINVSGNVSLILVQSANESVKVYNNYYTKNALVQQKDGELRVSSYEKETLIVVVYVSNLSSITASENATIKTHGKFSALNLDVNLTDYAKADLNTNTISLNTSVNGNANLILTGSTSDYNAVVNRFSKVNMTNFVAEITSIRTQKIDATAPFKALALPIAE